jgi:hypothetical protein
MLDARASTGFIRRSHLAAWVRRIGADADLRDCATVAWAITKAIRTRGNPDHPVSLARICEIAGTSRSAVLHAMRRLRDAERLICNVHWHRRGVPGDKPTIAGFDFTISSAADEAAHKPTPIKRSESVMGGL